MSLSEKWNEEERREIVDSLSEQLEIEGRLVASTRSMSEAPRTGR